MYSFYTPSPYACIKIMHLYSFYAGTKKHRYFLLRKNNGVVVYLNKSRNYSEWCGVGKLCLCSCTSLRLTPLVRLLQSCPR